MYEIYFYRNAKGIEPAYEYIKELQESKNLELRKRADKINDYIEVLSQLGKSAGEPYIKHIEGELWELRPSRDRVFFRSVDRKFFFFCYIHFSRKRKKRRNVKLHVRLMR